MIRALQADDLPAAHALSTQLGWPHRLEDYQFMLSQGAGVAVERDGVLAGTGMGWRYGADAAALGMIMVAPALQGQGLGRQIMARVMDSLGERTVRLHATAAGMSLYRSLGFVAGPVVRQFQGVVRAGAAPPGVRALTADDAAEVAARDRSASGMDRSALIAALLPHAEGVALAAGRGFALWRRFGRGTLIGPVVAPDAASARLLIDAGLAALVGEFVRVDVREASGLGAILTARGLEDAGAVVQMERGAAMTGAGYFALISQAFG